MLENISWEGLLLFLVGTLFSIIGFFLRDLHRRLCGVETGLQDHRVEDAKNLVPRTEMQTLMVELKEDIRGMLSPIHQKVNSMEQHLREHK